MNEDLINDSEPKTLAVSAVVAVVIHALVFFSWSKISLEQNAYAIGNRGSVEMILSSLPLDQPVTDSTPPQEVVPVAPPEPIKAPSEFKKRVKTKPVEKKIVKETPVAPVEKVTSSTSSELAADSANKVIGDTQGQDVQGQAVKGTSVAEPDYLNNPPPKYPTESRRQHEEGVVVILAAINSAGRVESLKLSKSSGFERLDDAATAAVKDWKFKPARFAGITVDSSVEIPVRFSLK